MDSETREEMARLHARIDAQIRQLTRNIPSRWADGGDESLLVKIIGGNLQSGVQQISYLADPLTVNAFYDPLVDTIYPTGLGYGTLFEEETGLARGSVLVRHNFAGMPDSVMAGVTYLTGGTVTLMAVPLDAPPSSPAVGQKVVVGSSPSGAFAGHAGETATWNGSAWVFSAAPASLTMVAYTLTRG